MRKVLETESPIAILPEATACVQLLRGYLAKIASEEGKLLVKVELEEADLPASGDTLNSQQ